MLVVVKNETLEKKIEKEQQEQQEQIKEKIEECAKIPGNREMRNK